MSAVTLLERQLLEYWKKLESRKTWKGWTQWLQSVGCPISLTSPEHVTPGEKMNYLTFFREHENALALNPVWFQQLSSPDWLHSQHLVILPPSSVVAPATKDSSPDLVQSQIRQLTQELQNLQRRMSWLETRATSVAALPGSSSMAMESPASPGSPPKVPLNQAQIMEKELTLRQLSKKQKPVPSLEESPQAPLPPLNDIYLSMKEWCDHFANAGLDLQELAFKPIEVPSSHQISFNQFGRRIERFLENKNALSEYLKQFEMLHRQGFNPNLVVGPPAQPE